MDVDVVTHKDLDKVFDRLARFEALLLAKTFEVPVQPVRAPSEVVPSEKPFLQTSTGNLVENLPADGSNLVQQDLVEAATTSQEVVLEEGEFVQDVQVPGADFPNQTAHHQVDHADDLSSESGYQHLYQEESADRQLEPVPGDQEVSTDQGYRETIRAIRAFMEWNQVPEFESSSSTPEDNPFMDEDTPAVGQLSIKLPVDEWLCRKMEKLNVTLQEGYPARGSDATSLSKDQFIRQPIRQKWYSMYSGQKEFSKVKVHSWSQEPARLNSYFPRIAKASSPSAPASRPLNQEALRTRQSCATRQLDSAVVPEKCNTLWQTRSRSFCLIKLKGNFHQG